MQRTRRLAVCAGLLAATVVLAGCGGDEDSSEPAAPEDSSSTTTDGQTAEPTTAECVGKDGKITIGSDAPVDLPGGSTAQVSETDVEGDPPTVTFELGDSTKIEQQNATGLSVGDQFGVARAVYVVKQICSDEAAIDTF